MRVLPYILYLFLIAAHGVILRDLTGIYSATVNLPALVVLLVALYKDDVPATWFGFAAGLVMAAAGPPALLGWHALIMASLALGSCQVRVRLNLDSLNARLLFVLGGVAAHNLVVLIFSRTDSFFYYLLSNGLTGAVYTTLIAWFFFLIKERHLTYAKVRALF